VEETAILQRQDIISETVEQELATDLHTSSDLAI
jgi:hypothetical protein